MKDVLLGYCQTVGRMFKTKNQSCKIQKRSIVFKSKDTEKVQSGLRRRKKVYSVEENKLG